jgi:hypothetical protein
MVSVFDSGMQAEFTAEMLLRHCKVKFLRLREPSTESIRNVVSPPETGNSMVGGVSFF